MLYNVIGYDNQILGQVDTIDIQEAWVKAGKQFDNILDVRPSTETILIEEPKVYMVDDIKVSIKYERPGVHEVIIEPPGNRSITEEEGERITKLIGEVTTKKDLEIGLIEIMPGDLVKSGVWMEGDDYPWLTVLSGPHKTSWVGQPINEYTVTDGLTQNNVFEDTIFDHIRKH